MVVIHSDNISTYYLIHNKVYKAINTNLDHLTLECTLYELLNEKKYRFLKVSLRGKFVEWNELEINNKFIFENAFNFPYMVPMIYKKLSRKSYEHPSYPVNKFNNYRNRIFISRFVENPLVLPVD